MSKSNRDNLDYLQDIIDAINKAQKFVKGIDYNDFSKDEKTIFAVIRAIEIIGEASKKISNDLKKQYPQIPWKAIAGMRDVLIHDYFGVDTQTVWTTIKKNIPEIKPKIKKIFSELNT